MRILEQLTICEHKKNFASTHTLKRNRLSCDGKVSVTGRQQPRQSQIFHGTASARGGMGIESTCRHPSSPEPSLRHCRAAIAACREVNVTTAYDSCLVIFLKNPDGT